VTNHCVLIVGAGPTGLALALWLTRLGVRVRIIDKTAEPGTTSRALAVQVRTLEFYRQVGMAELIISGGVKIACLNFWVKGAKVARAPLQRIGEGLTPYPFVLVFPQDDHERLLIEQLHALDVHVERRTELIGFDRSDGGVRAVLRLSSNVKFRILQAPRDGDPFQFVGVPSVFLRVFIVTKSSPLRLGRSSA
jgi:2-polyprenyl-6-methoxyphenol hydroxylase-like FAD-dependent oxidoreductase